MIEIDARGTVCPVPVIMTKKALRENTAGENISVRVDNEIATQNLTKMADQLHIVSSVTKLTENEYQVLYQFDSDDAVCTLMDNTDFLSKNENEYAVVINSEMMGTGDEAFGKKLMENFIYALTEQDSIPKTVVLYHSGIMLSAKNEKTIADLKALEEKGSEILSCGLCLDFYGLKDQLQVGSATNMYRIVEIMRTHKVVSP